MKKNITLLIGAILFTIYDLYILISYLRFYILKDTYGNVYQNILIYPHFILMVIGTILTYLAYFKNSNKLWYIAIGFFLTAAIFLFI
jgi:hypothetical protein